MAHERNSSVVRVESLYMQGNECLQNRISVMTVGDTGKVTAMLSGSQTKTKTLLASGC